jgi:hypothetical protein
LELLLILEPDHAIVCRIKVEGKHGFFSSLDTAEVPARILFRVIREIRGQFSGASGL